MADTAPTVEDIRKIIREELAAMNAGAVTPEKVREISEEVMATAGRAVSKKIGRKPSVYNLFMKKCHLSNWGPAMKAAEARARKSAGNDEEKYKEELKKEKRGEQTKWIAVCVPIWKKAKEEAKAQGIEKTNSPEFKKFMEEKGYIDKEGTEVKEEVAIAKPRASREEVTGETARSVKSSKTTKKKSAKAVAAPVVAATTEEEAEGSSTNEKLEKELGV